MTIQEEIINSAIQIQQLANEISYYDMQTKEHFRIYNKLQYHLDKVEMLTETQGIDTDYKRGIIEEVNNVRKEISQPPTSITPDW